MSLVSKAQPKTGNLRSGVSAGSGDPRRTADRPRRLRVGLLLPVWYLGGVERYHVALAKWTTDAIEWVGCALTAGAIVRQPSLDSLAELMPIHCDLTTGGRDARWSVIRHDSEQQAIDAVLSQADVLITWGVQSLESRLQGFAGRVIVISHGDGAWTRGWLQEAEQRATDRVAVSLEAAQAFRNPADVVILPGGVELDRLAPTQSRESVRQVWGIGNRKAIGFVGRFSPEKNPLMLAKIVGQLGPGYVAVYHGHSPFGEAAFRAEATGLAQGRIVFVGPEWHTGDVYRGLDCLVQLSPAEGGPLVAMEAWIAGVPLVTTDVGIVKDDRDLRGFSDVTLAGDVDAAATAVLAAVTSPRGRSAARLLATERYSAAAMARRWEEFLDKSASGPGSSLRQTRTLRADLPELLHNLNVKSLLDLPCGDCHWSSRMDLDGIAYLGGDVNTEQIDQNRRNYPERAFEVLDVIESPLPCVDAILCRDCLVHVKNEGVQRAIANVIASGSGWFIATHFPGRENVELGEGTWKEVWRPIDLTAAPFNLPAPRYVINEGCTWFNRQFADKSLGVWRVADLRG